MAWRAWRSETAFDREVVEPGASAGLVGGIVMACWAMIVSAIHGSGFLAPLTLIGATFIGPAAVDGLAGVVLWGLVQHLTIACCLGVLFAAMARTPISTGAAFGAGLVYGIGVMLVMTFIVTPIVNPVLRSTVPMMRGAWLIEHLLYGGSMLLVPVFRSRVVPVVRPVLRPAR